MDIELPEPGGLLNDGPVTVPRLAATVILVRGGGERLEVLLVRRNPSARLMGGVWVFPGGSVDPGDGPPGDDRALWSGDAELAPGALLALEAAAVRELREEAGIELDPGSELLPFARWITPVQMLRRFDAWFFLATAPADVEPVVDGAEIVEHRWYAPADALEAASRDELQLVFPTIRQLQRLAGHSTADALLVAARESEIVAVQPRVDVANGRARVVLCDDPAPGTPTTGAA